MSNLEIFVTGSSRPQLWPYFWDSVRKMCIMREWPKVRVHEDSIFPIESDKVIEYVKSQSDIHDLIIDKPAIGLGNTLTNYFRESTPKFKYIFYIQEDWEFERPIDIDEITFIMDENPNINCVIFNKIKNMGSVNRQEQKEYIFHNRRFCLYHSWSFMPSIWRSDFVKNILATKSNNHFRSERPEGGFSKLFGEHQTRNDVEYCYNNIGAFLYGCLGDYRYVRHLGNDWRMATWRMENGKPGGNNNSDTMDKPYMAPWVPYIERPSTKGDLAKI